MLISDPSKVAFVRTTLAALLLGLAALIVIVLFNLWLVREAGVYSERVNAARLQRTAIIDLQSLILDAETGQRGYLLTGNPAYLKPYLEARQNSEAQLASFLSIMNGDAPQKVDASKIIPLITNKLAELQQTIDLANANKRDEALARVKTDLGQAFMVQARRLFSVMLQRSEATIDMAVRDEQQSIATLRWVTICGAIFIVVVVGGSTWVVMLYTRRLIHAQKEIGALNQGLEERVRERTAELGRANQEIQRFAYIVTHDLRAPLVNIMGFTSELEESLKAIQSVFRPTDANGEVNPSDRPAAEDARTAVSKDLPEAIGFIRSSIRKMDRLINAILKLSREGRRVLTPEALRVDALLKNAAANVQHQIAEADGEVAIEAKVPAVISDRLALEQIFGNLLENAVKYREPQRPLKIMIRAHESPGRRIIVEIEDNGRGIAKADHERVFELFRRSGDQDLPGEGIGLAHARTMMRNLGGDITLASELGQGTTIKLNLPKDLRPILAIQNGVDA
jgi:signal transduction histidine kinase